MNRIVVVCCAMTLAGFACMNPSQSPSQAVDVNSSIGTAVINISNGDFDGTLAKTAVVPKFTGVEHVWLTIKKVDVHTSSDSWVTIAEPNARFDFLNLVNGLTTPLNLYPLPSGHYTQIRLILAEDVEGEAAANEIVVNGQSFPIRIPSGTQSGIKCIHQFTIEPNQQTEICLQFDVLKAINFNNGNGYMMKPAYKTIQCDGSQSRDIPQ
jgi:hypothetical protein